MKNRPYWAFAFMSRYSLAMAVLAFALWLTSWPLHWLHGRGDLPNCVAACWEDDTVAVGCVSIRRTCSLFLSFQTYGFESYDHTGWREIRDGHFCGFPIPPTSMDPAGPNPTGFSLHLSHRTIGWSIPYWIFMASWLLVFGKTMSSTRFSIRDLVLAMTFVALLVTMFRLELALIGILLLNASTLLLAVHFLTSALRSFIQTDNILWPVLFQEEADAPQQA